MTILDTPTDHLPVRSRGTTSDALLAAAAAEFNENGFSGTDTNRIARRAGFAPQTFYRWFADKQAAFVEVYEQWQQQEVRILEVLLKARASNEKLARAIVDHHRAHLVFRRSLRHLATTDDVVRAARARSRLRQIAFLRRANATLSAHDDELAAGLLQIERLADAIAESEFRDMGLDDGGALAILGRLLHALRGSRDERLRSSLADEQCVR